MKDKRNKACEKLRNTVGSLWTCNVHVWYSSDPTHPYSWIGLWELDLEGSDHASGWIQYEFFSWWAFEMLRREDHVGWSRSLRATSSHLLLYLLSSTGEPLCSVTHFPSWYCVSPQAHEQQHRVAQIKCPPLSRFSQAFCHSSGQATDRVMLLILIVAGMPISNTCLLDTLLSLGAACGKIPT